MSVCYRLVLDSVCRSNHHRLAVMALDHLQGETAGDWRNLFLKHRKEYLEGAKAPDEVFKDFKNHVLHVRDGDWGGAPQAAREWYRRAVRALREQDWPHAAWCAGVMSHYVVDPVQPFHTHQTEEEGVIHRALEWSLSKSFPELFAILNDELGYPDIPVPTGDTWLEQMVRAGALVSNKHYETLIDHFDFAASRKRPQDGLDQEIKDVVAALMGYATVMLSRVFDRAIAESQAEAPKVSLAFDTVGIVAATPMRAIAKRAEKVAEQKLVRSQYAEFRKTGKVRETLSEDDKIVRRLHAEEVLKVSLSSLDCQWPRETGTANGRGAEPRSAKKAKQEKPSRAKPGLKLEKQAPAPSSPERGRGKTSRTESTRGPGGGPSSKLADVAAPAAKATSAPTSLLRVRLTREASVVDAPSIGPKTAGRLGVIGVKTVGDLLALSPDDAAPRIKAGHINAQIIRDWQAQALLACSVPDLPGTAAQLLVGAGVMTIEDLASAEPDFLLDAVTMFAQSNEGERALRGQTIPDRARLKGWIEAAQAISQGRTAA